MAGSSHELMKCPKCLTPNNVSRAKAGTKIRCQRCGGMITVRAAEAAAEPADVPPPRPSEERPGRASGGFRRDRASTAAVRAARSRAAQAEEAEPEGDEEDSAPAQRGGRGGYIPPKPVPTGAIASGIFALCGLGIFFYYMISTSTRNVSPKFDPVRPPSDFTSTGGVPATPGGVPLEQVDWVVKTPAYNPGGDKGGSDTAKRPPRATEGGGGMSSRVPVHIEDLKCDPLLVDEIASKLSTFQEISRGEIATETNAIVARGESVVPALIIAVGHSDEWVGLSATDVLKKATGMNFRLDPGMAQSDREEVRDRWIRWYLDGGKK